MKLSKTKQLEIFYSINTDTNLGGKLYILEKSLDEADKLLKYKRNADIIRKLHFLQLDIIAKLCFVIEDFLYFYRFMRKNTKNIYKEILINKTKWANKEAKHLIKNLNQKEIKEIYNFPDISSFKINREDLKLLRIAIKKTIKFHEKNLKIIGRFWNRHKIIYDIFKHGCSIVTGMFDKKDLYKPSHFYARAIESKKTKRVKTYAVTCTDEIFKYYDDTRKRIYSTFDSLLKSRQLALLNPTKQFIPPLFDIDDKNEIKRIERILKKINKPILSFSSLKRDIKINENILKKSKRRTSYITRIRRDIMFSSRATIGSNIIRKNKEQIDS
ncbi:MAG: hypothetical protein WBA71_02505 [Candidatus Humimicrobiia bacterium]